MCSFPCPVPGCEPVLCSHMYGGSRRKATDFAHAVLLEAVQGSGTVHPGSEHHVRLSGQCGYLFTGKLLGFCLLANS